MDPMGNIPKKPVLKKLHLPLKPKPRLSRKPSLPMRWPWIGVACLPWLCCVQGDLSFTPVTGRILGEFHGSMLAGTLLGGGFKYVLFSPLFGEMIHFD